MDKTHSKRNIPLQSSPEEANVAGDITRRLMATGRFSSGQVDVSAWNDTIRLRGRVHSYYQKQLAQTAAMALAGGRRLQNEMEVHQPSL